MTKQRGRPPKKQKKQPPVQPQLILDENKNIIYVKYPEFPECPTECPTEYIESMVDFLLGYFE
jgi:hypothetical protein